MRVVATIVFLCASLLGAGLSFAQGSGQSAGAKATTRKAANIGGRSECAVAVGLCVSVPAGWQRLGDIFDNLGFVVAEPHPGVDQSSWPQLNVAAIDVPAQSNGAPRSLDSLIDVVLAPDGSFTSKETVERTRLLLNGANAEIVRVRLHGSSPNGDVSGDRDAKHDAAGGTDTNADVIEEVALIEGDGGFVYSIALRCAPQDFERLEGVFQRAAHSWRVKPVTQTSGGQSSAVPTAGNQSANPSSANPSSANPSSANPSSGNQSSGTQSNPK